MQKPTVETVGVPGTPTRLATGRLRIGTEGRAFVEITAPVAEWLVAISARTGLLTAFARHTSASLAIQENADPDVRRDLLSALEALAPEGRHWIHDAEGPDDMPAHVRSMLTGASLSVPVVDGRMALGTWQGLYLVEHRRRPHRREVIVSFVGD